MDEAYAPQQLDDHDLMFRMRKQLGKVCGCYWIDFTSEPAWGASRKETTGFSEANPVNAASHHKNSKLFYDRYADVLDAYRIIEDRGYVEQVLIDGANTAKEVSMPLIEKIRSAVGIRGF